uniref:Uncharacterized protein n=1 Tax=Podoviridae sp. cty7j44 TaxID=2826593 RepID=A0A8S5QXW4_9CAUD|nr:MAG TPA: hypothetical protein [Podoviridae sp. cty7j44]
MKIISHIFHLYIIKLSHSYVIMFSTVEERNTPRPRTGRAERARI